MIYHRSINQKLAAVDLPGIFCGPGCKSCTCHWEGLDAWSKYKDKKKCFQWQQLWNWSNGLQQLCNLPVALQSLWKDRKRQFPALLRLRLKLILPFTLRIFWTWLHVIGILCFSWIQQEHRQNCSWEDCSTCRNERSGKLCMAWETSSAFKPHKFLSYFG